MADFFDYLSWRGDLTFSQDPFNEVDNIILAELSYGDFSNIGALENSFLSISELYAAYLETTSREDADDKKSLAKGLKDRPYLTNIASLLEKLSKTKRFENLKIGYYRKVIKKDPVVQFTAIIYLVDGMAYVAFGGTDDSFVGWQEDFYFSYTSGTASQLAAVAYLEEVSKIIDGNFYVGGHSKGGNLAIYAALFADDKIKDRIDIIWANDSPGFTADVLKEEGYKKIRDKIILYLPESSVVGLLMNQDVGEKVIIHAREKLFYQHFLLHWQVDGNKFLRAEKLSDDALFVNKALDTWLSEIEIDKRKEVVDGIFYCLEMTKAKDFADFQEGGLNSLRGLLAASKTLPQDQYDLIVDLIRKLISNSKDLFFENVLDSMAQKKASIQEKIEGTLASREKKPKVLKSDKC